MPRAPLAAVLAAVLVFVLVAAAVGEIAVARAQPAPPLTLPVALDRAFERSEIVGIAAARVAQADAVRQRAIAQLVPSLTLSGTYIRRARAVTRTIDDDEVTVQAIDALGTQALVESTLFDLRALPVIRAATLSRAAQVAESEELSRALAFDVADTFYGVLSAERLRAAAERRVEVAAATVEESRLRLDAGLANRNDLTRTELELATARLAATEAENLVATTRVALAVLLDAESLGPLVEPGAPPVPPGDRATLVTLAEGSSRTLAALADRAAAARFQARAPRLGLVPTLDLRGLYRWTNEAGLSGREEDWNVGLTLTWRVFDGGDRDALAAQLDALAREAELVHSAERRALAADVDRALADHRTADAALAQAAVRRDVARQNAEEVRERYVNGLATALEQADALVGQFEAEAGLARQGFAAALARLAIERAVGFWPADWRPATPTPEVSP